MNTAPQPAVRTVLVVDDDASNLGVMAALLARAGCEVKLAANGREGTAAAAPAPDLAFVDLHLPDMDGIALVKILRQDGPNTFIVVATMDDDPRTLHAAYDAGCDMFLVKPYNAMQIMELVPMARRGRRWMCDRFGLREYLGR